MLAYVNLAKFCCDLFSLFPQYLMVRIHCGILSEKCIKVDIKGQDSKNEVSNSGAESEANSWQNPANTAPPSA